MIILSQRNPKWAQIKIGNTQMKISRWGCTLTCLSMLSDYFDSFNTPEELATRILKFTPDGLVIWQSVNNIGHMTFEKRLYDRNDVEIRKSLLDPSKAVILEVDHSHWIVALKKSIFGGYWCADPWFGDKCYNTRYKKITGSAHFKRK